MRPPRALAARGALMGAVGGATAGLYDFTHALTRAATFLPSGRWKLGLFLCALYGAAGAVVVAVAGVVLGALLWASDGGALWRAAFAGEELSGRRWAAYALATAAMLVALGALLDPIALDSLRHYHHRLLIAALVGAAGTALFVAGAALVLLLAAALSPLIRLGPPARIHFRAPAGIEAAGWILGLYAGWGAVTALVLALEQRPRMPPPYQALNVALWAPPLLLACVLGAHFIARRLPLRERALATPRGALVAVTLALGGPMLLVLAFQWSLVRQLDLRPFAAVAVFFLGLVVTLWVDLGRGLRRRPLLLRGALALGLPAALLAIALGTGRLDRVRKAAVSFTGASAPIVAILQRATDLDGDGYSSILGGGDCNDFDRSVHPGAVDFPDDGIDQDCNGHQATLTPPARAPFAPVPPSLAHEPNVVLITIDALRADHVSAYGYARPTTPRLDALARESVLFADAWAHAPSTRYSVPAILTGRYPSTIATGLAHWPPNILPENRLLAEMLHDRGYHTGATASYGGNGYFEPGWGIFQGFDEYDVHLKALHSLYGDPSNTHGTSSRQLADLDIDWIGKHKDQKFFLWTHFYDTHFGFEPHPDLPESRFGPSEMDLYDGEIRFTDFHIGRVFDALKAAGLWDKTIIIVTADHGDGFGEHGIPPDQRHGYHLYATETKVPLIIKLPGLPPRVVHTPVGHIDIVPTLLNALGAAAGDEPTLLGQSRLGLMSGSAPDDDAGTIFQEVTYEGPTSRYNGTQKRALVTHAWHYLDNRIPDGTRELYRRSPPASDPLEEHDLAGLGEAAEPGLAAQLAAWMDQIALPPDASRHAGDLADRPFAPAEVRGDRFGGWLTLDGVDAPATARAGQSFEVKLYWHATAAAPAGWRLFTHVVSGGRMLNLDHEPAGGTVPLARLRPGRYLRDAVPVTLPAGWPAGPLTVQVGLWRGNERAPVSGPHAAADGAVEAARVTVQP